ncbi:MAG: hypothetical protein J1F32_02755 [Erysipelotrichales bacterium]|nr:hypothetical protein [Erysipelotrichales bacterium]
MSKKLNRLMVLGAVAMLLGACGPKEPEEVTFDIVNNEYIPSSYKGKTTYTSYIATPLKSLNTALTMSAENGQHIANFVDGLLENNSYGRLSKALAEKIFVNDSYTKYKFYIRGNELGKGTADPIPWLKWDGTQYNDRVAGPQYVTGEDFVTSAMYVLDARNQSDCYYLPAMFIRGGYEYWAYTYADYLSRQPNSSVKMDSDAAIAENINKFAKQYGNLDLNVTASMVDDIKNGRNIGIKAGKENDPETDVEYYYVEYELQSPAEYFPSVLTYTPFLPINDNFVKNSAQGITLFGTGSKERLLYCGAYLLDKWEASGTLVYKKNAKYWDAKNVHIDTITYNLLPEGTNDDFIRKEYELGKIDSFGVAQTDEEGWKKYVTGQKGEGSIESPVNSDVYSREIDTVDSTFYTQLNVNRKNYSKNTSAITEDENERANAAIKINAVRDLLLNGVDYTIYNQRYGLAKDMQNQYQMWTFIPKGFVEDKNGKDYIEYVYEAYADKYGMDKEDVRELLKQGQLPESYDPDANTKELAKKAKAAVEYWMSQNNGEIEYKVDGIKKTHKLNFPIKFEYLGLNFDAKQSVWDSQWIEKFNETVNACTTNRDKVSSGLTYCDGGKYPYFEIVKNEKVTAVNYSSLGESGEYQLYVVGWGADYADPLTYLNTMTTGGDMCGYAGTQEEVPDYVNTFDKDGKVVSGTRKDNMLDIYDDLVARGAATTNNTIQRYELFAQAEVELLFEVHIMSPDYMSGQGWSVTVSRLAGYETPSAAYGLSSYKLKGVYALTKAMGGADRKAAKAKFDANKKNALATSSDEDIFDGKGSQYFN